MERLCGLLLTVILAGAPAANAQDSALEDLKAAGGTAEELSFPAPAASPSAVPSEGFSELPQFLPEKNYEPGFDWPVNKSAASEEWFQTGDVYTYFKRNDSDSDQLIDGTGKCALMPNTKYLLSAKPGFEGEYVKAALKEPLPGCSFTEGYLYMEHVAATSAGGACELPAAVRAFLDTLAYSEGTDAQYNYIFTHAVFTSYADHPRKRKCAGKLCSDAAGRYQFLSKTWDPLAEDLGLKDFTPPSQDMAVVELIRRDGAYNAVAGSANHENFKRAVTKLNNIWASLPGSEYGQPTHPMATLWAYHKTALAKYK